MYIHIWRLPAQLSQGQAALNVPSQHRNVSDIHTISDQINLGVPTTHHVHTYIYAYVLRWYCFHFISVLYTLSTQRRSCGLSEQLVKSRCIAPLYAFLHNLNNTRERYNLQERMQTNNEIAQLMCFCKANSCCPSWPSSCPSQPSSCLLLRLLHLLLVLHVLFFIFFLSMASPSNFNTCARASLSF